MIEPPLPYILWALLFHINVNNGFQLLEELSQQKAFFSNPKTMSARHNCPWKNSLFHL